MLSEGKDVGKPKLNAHTSSKLYISLLVGWLVGWLDGILSSWRASLAKSCSIRENSINVGAQFVNDCEEKE